VLAADLARRAGLTVGDGIAVAFPAGLTSAAVVPGAATEEPLVAVDVDAENANVLYVLVPTDNDFRLTQLQSRGNRGRNSTPISSRAQQQGADLTRRIRHVPAGADLVDRLESGSGRHREGADAAEAEQYQLNGQDEIPLPEPGRHLPS
jgi:hypothetical protein